METKDKKEKKQAVELDDSVLEGVTGGAAVSGEPFEMGCPYCGTWLKNLPYTQWRGVCSNCGGKICTDCGILLKDSGALFLDD